MAKIKTHIFDANNCFFTADLHIGHAFAVKLRNFDQMDKMHNDLIHKWNEIITDKDDVFILGDVSFANTANTMAVLGQLNGHLHLIRGNHDSKLSNIVLDRFTTVTQMKEIYVRDLETSRQVRVFMSHYSHRVWNMSHYGAYHLYGHSHGSLKGFGRSMDVGLDTNNNRPYKWGEIDNKLKRIEVHQIDHHKVKNKAGEF